MRLGICPMVLFACSILSTRATGDETTPATHADSTPASSMITVPAENFQKWQGSSLIQTVITRTYTRQYGTALDDSLTGITSDTLGNVYISGNSMNSDFNGFIRKYSSEGTLLWTKTKSIISIDGITLDNNGKVYIAGSYATGSLLATRHFVYLEKYNSNGSLIWTKSFKAEPASDPTRMIVNGIATDPNGNGFIIMLFERAYWPYQTRQVFIKKYNSSGLPIWEKPAGNSSPYTSRPVLAVDKSGKTYTAINSAIHQRWNTTISQFDSQGDPIWSTLFNAMPFTTDNYVHGITADSDGNLLIAGITKTSLEGVNLGFYDAFIRKYDNTSAVLWTRQFGTAANDYANSLTTDTAGNVYLAGSSSGTLSSTNRGTFDAVMRKYGRNGEFLHSRQFGTTEFDIANVIRLDTVGNLYVAGHSFGNLAGVNNGGQDVYFRKFTISP